MSMVDKLQTIAENQQKIYNAGFEAGRSNGGVGYSGEFFANALKGSAHGKAVSITDVSPIEHVIGITVESKNLLDIPNLYNGSVVAASIDIICNIDSPITISVTNDNAEIKDASGEPRSIWRFGVFQKSGESYIIDDEIINAPSQRFSKTFPATKDNPIVSIKYRSTYITSGGYKDIQVEKGAVATPYTPHIADVSSVKVYKSGKNLAYVLKDYDTSGSNTLDTRLIANRSGYYCSLVPVTPNTVYAVSKESNASGRFRVFFYDTNPMDGEAKSIGGYYNDSAIRGLATTPENCKYLVVAWGNVLEKFQVELGSVYTEYDDYIEPVEYTVDAIGTVSDVSAIYPSTTLTTDTVGALIRAEYNRDLNKAFEELCHAIISMGGNI